MSSCEGEIVNNPPLKRKKGKKLVEYKCEKIKKSRVKNEEYKNWRGNLVKPKNHGFDCRCRWKCLPDKITEDLAVETYTKFIDLNTKNEQDSYLQSLIECKPIERKRRELNNNGKIRKPKTHTFAYSVSTGGYQQTQFIFHPIYNFTQYFGIVKKT